MTEFLSHRQKLAEAAVRALVGIKGVWVTSALPLDDRQKLRLQISDFERNQVIQKIRDWGYGEPVCLGVASRFDTMGQVAACAYELDFPREHAIPQEDRTILRAEIERKQQTPGEAAAIMKHLGLTK